MVAPTSPFVIRQIFRLPGLGLLALPTLIPDWLALPSLHTALALHLHRPNELPLLLIATVEELAYNLESPVRALLLDVDFTAESLVDAWLVLKEVVSDELL